jgi:hypothetical protein
MRKIMKNTILISLMLVVAACTAEAPEVEFDRAGLLPFLAADQQDAVRAADRHILVVRHARKIAPDCNALDCPLSPRGESMVTRLSEVVGETPVDAAYSSAACRTLLTAQAGHLPVVVHQAADGYETGCTEGETVSRQRSEAFAEALDADNRWTIVAEHSNTSCSWVSQFAGEDAAGSAGCIDGRLPHDAYGQIYWLYRTNNAWNVAVLADAFEVPAAD